MLVANERKEGPRKNKKADSGNGNSETKDHPDVLFVVRGLR